MTPLATVEIMARERILVASVAGEVDASNVDDIRTRITAMIPNEALGVVVDLSEVRYLDSAGVGLLFELAGRLSAAGQHIRLTLPESSLVRRVLELTAVEAVAPIDTSLEASLAELEAALGT